MHDYKLAVLVYKCLHGLALSNLADKHHHLAESEFRRRLHSSSSQELSVPRTRLSTYGDRAVPVAAVRTWNSLPQHVTSAPSLPAFCCRLKTYFFELCYRNYCCRVREVTLSFVDLLAYLLPMWCDNK